MRPAIAAFCVTRPYTPSGLAPIWILAVLSLVTELYFFFRSGLDVIHRPYLWPGFVLTPFFLYCAISRRFAPWHRWFWRLAQVWSGFWTISFLLLLPTVFGLLAFMPVVFWCQNLGINPWLALGLHLLFFACCCDILRQEETSTKR